MTWRCSKSSQWVSALIWSECVTSSFSLLLLVLRTHVMRDLSVQVWMKGVGGQARIMEGGGERNKGRREQTKKRNPHRLYYSCSTNCTFQTCRCTAGYFSGRFSAFVILHFGQFYISVWLKQFIQFLYSLVSSWAQTMNIFVVNL